MEETLLLNGRLRVIVGDITACRTDAVVNAANSSLLGGGGVDGAIHRAGGPDILAQCRELRARRFPSGLPAGEAAATTAGRLPCRYVIHTVGPVWQGGHRGEADTLAGCYRRSLEEAAHLELASVAFPSISTGAYGYPKEEAARVAYGAVRGFLENNRLPETITFVFFSPGEAKLFLLALNPPER